MGHRNFICDGCDTRNFHGRRFHCLRCVNYDLCGECYDQRTETLDHRADHPMQLLLDHDRHHQQLPELLANGDLVELINLPNCYTCPYCGIFGHTAKELIDHVVAVHRQAETHVVCPICAGLPGMELVTMRNLARHLLLNHIEHANLLDPHTPPLRHTLSRVSRRRRRQQPQNNQSNQNSNHSRSSARSNSSRMDSEAGIDILYQLSELRRLRPELRFNQAPPNYNDAEVRSRPTVPPIVSPGMPANVRPVQGYAKGPTSNSSRFMEHSDANRYLLHRWMIEQQSDANATLRENMVRQKHALFTEHLLLSMLSEEELQLPPNSHLLTDLPLQSSSQRSKRLHLPDFDDDIKSLDGRSDDQNPGLKCKYTPSHVMMLMSLPWIRTWSEQTKQRYIELQGATLDESSLVSGEQQDID